jgi:hypothetical protein
MPPGWTCWRSITTGATRSTPSDPNGNMVEFCATTGSFTQADRERALAALDETEFKPSPPPAKMQPWPAAEKAGA